MRVFVYIGLAILFSPLVYVQLSLAQGCCSGGAPISANLGFSSVPQNTLQAALTFDINNLSTLKDGERILTGSDRTRATYSALLNLGYTFLPRLSVDVMVIPYVRQVRQVVVNNVTSEFTTVEGFGDMVVLPKFLVTAPENLNTQLQLAAGIKIPTGHSSIKINSIEANPDLQPGSGAWDLLFWGNFYHSLNSRPSLGITSTINFRLTGANNQYLTTHIYEFGDDFHWLNTVSDQFVLGKLILTPSLGIKYRVISGTNIDLNQVDNTGGNWITSVFGLAFQVYQLPTFTLLGEIPVYSNVTGIQLSSTYRLSFGLQYQFGSKERVAVPNPKF